MTSLNLFRAQAFTKVREYEQESNSNFIHSCSAKNNLFIIFNVHNLSWICVKLDIISQFHTSPH